MNYFCIKRAYILLLFFLSFVSSVYCHAEGLLSVKNIEQKPFSISASHISTWEKDGIRVFVASKDIKILQGPFQITANSAVCWFREGEATQFKQATIEVYCEGNVTIFEDENFEKFAQVYLRFETMTGIVVNSETQVIETLEEPHITDIVLRGEEIRSMDKEEYLSTEISKKIPPGAPKKEEVVDIIADNIDSWQEGNKRVVVALGNVKIKQGDMTLDADSVILWFDQPASGSPAYSEGALSEFYAEGNVTMRQKDDVQIADKIFENAKEGKGILINSQIKTSIQKEKKDKTSDTSGTKTDSKKAKKPISEEMSAYISGEEIQRIGEGQYEIKNGAITNCGYGHPHYHFKGKRIRLIQSEGHNIVSTANNSFYLGKYPVAYFPYLSLDIRKNRPLKDWQFGSSSRFGAFIRTDWDLYAVTGGNQSDWSDLTLNLDYLQERGIGTGLDFEYKTKDMYGFVDTYYIKDQGDFDIKNIPIEHEDRGTFLWRHRQELPHDWQLDMEYSYLSDPRFLREYFEHEFKEEKDHETVLYLHRIQDNRAETFLINEQLNGFDNTVDTLRERRYAERLPEVTYRVIGEPFLDNRLLYTSESAVTYFDSSFDQIEQTVQPQSLLRVDTVNRVNMPFNLWAFNIDPFVEGRITGYSESIDTSGAVDEGNGPATGRFIGSLGFDWSSTHWRTYSIYNDLFEINRLRHVFTPTLRYTYSPVVTDDPNEFYQYDEVDATDSSQVLVIGIKNMLQTKRGEPGLEKTIDFVEFNIDYYMFPTNAGLHNEGINGIIIREDNFINIDFRSQLTDIIAFVSERNEFNTEELQFDVLTSGVEIYNPPDWQYFLGHRFIRDISSTVIAAADYKISEKWGVLFAEKYDLKSTAIDIDKNRDDAEAEEDIDSKPKNLKTNFVLSRYFHDWVGSLTLELDPIRNDNSYRFDITPRGLQKTSRRFWF